MSVQSSTTASDSFSFGDDSLATTKNSADFIDVERDMLAHDHVDTVCRDSTASAIANASEIGRRRAGSLELEEGRDDQEGQDEEVHGQANMLHSSPCLPVKVLAESPQKRGDRGRAGCYYSKTPTSTETMSDTGTDALPRVSSRRNRTPPSSLVPNDSPPRTRCRTSSDYSTGSWGSGSGADGKEEAAAAKEGSNIVVNVEQRVPGGSRVEMAAASAQAVEEVTIAKKSPQAMGADDFLPLFALALVSCSFVFV